MKLVSRKEVVFNPLQKIIELHAYACSSKTKYKTESLAIRRSKDQTLNEGIRIVYYFCESCNNWHLTKEKNMRLFLMNNLPNEDNLKKIIGAKGTSYIYHTHEKWQKDPSIIIQEGLMVAYESSKDRYVWLSDKRRLFPLEITSKIKHFTINQQLTEQLVLLAQKILEEENNIEELKVGKRIIIREEVKEKEVSLVSLVNSVKVPVIDKNKFYNDSYGKMHKILLTERGSKYIESEIECILCHKKEIIQKRLVKISSGYNEQTMNNHLLNNLQRKEKGSSEWVHKTCLEAKKNHDISIYNHERKEVLKEAIEEASVVAQKMIDISKRKMEYDLPFDQNTLMDLLKHSDPSSGVSDAFVRGMTYIFIKEVVERLEILTK